MSEQADPIRLAGDEGVRTLDLAKHARIALGVLSGGALLLSALGSLRWRMELDSPLMHYVGFAMTAFGDVPYRDVFDMNMLGTYTLHALAVRLVGTGDLGFRLWDLAWLGGIALATYGWMGLYGRRAAACAAVLFSLLYLGHGQAMSLQREVLALLPAACALALVPPGAGEVSARRLAGAGLCWGMSALIKPPFVLFALASLPAALLTLDAPRWRVRGARVAWLALGMATPLALALAWLAHRGALSHFLAIARGYWPLYNNLTGAHEPSAGMGRLAYLGESAARELRHWLLLPALASLALTAQRPALKRAAQALAACVLAGAVYVVVLGKFWFYHLLPLEYFLVCALCASLARDSGFVRREPRAAQNVLAAAAAVALAMVSASALASALHDLKHAETRADVKDGAPDRIAAFLRARMSPEDRVQPLDWTGGALHAMLLAGARHATPFIYDFHFYHHVDEPYIAQLRARFIGLLRAAPPRFVVEMTARPWPRGKRTTRSFPQLEALLARDYRVALSDPAFRIHERSAL